MAAINCDEPRSDSISSLDAAPQSWPLALCGTLYLFSDSPRGMVYYTQVFPGRDPRMKYTLDQAEKKVLGQCRWERTPIDIEQLFTALVRISLDPEA